MSGQSKSSRKRLSSNKKRELAHAEKHKIEARRRTSSPAANFIAMLVGMILSVMMIAFAVGQLNRSANETGGNDGGAGARSMMVDDDTGRIAGLDELLKAELEDRIYCAAKNHNKASLAGRGVAYSIQVLTNRIRLADRLLELTGNEGRRAFAIKSKINAATKIYGLDSHHQLQNGSVAKLLLDAAVPHIHHSNSEIARLSRLAIAKVDVFEFRKNMTAANFQSASGSIEGIVRDYPTDERAMSTINLLIRQLVMDSPDLAESLLNRMSEENQGNGPVEEVVSGLRDALLLHRIGIEQVEANYWANGENGRIALRQTIRQLIDHPEIGRGAISRIGGTLEWLEQNLEFELAKELAEYLVERSSRFQKREDCRLANTIGGASLKRMSCREQKLDIDGAFLRDGRMEEFSDHDRIKIVVFWDAGQESAGYFSKVKKIMSRHEAAGVSVVAVLLGDDFGDELLSEEMQEHFVQLSTDAPDWWFQAGDADSEQRSAFAERYPVLRAPHLLVIDEQGKVQRINVPADQLENEIDKALIGN